jgi:hypothetical protein
MIIIALLLDPNTKSLLDVTKIIDEIQKGKYKQKMNLQEM